MPTVRRVGLGDLAKARIDPTGSWIAAAGAEGLALFRAPFDGPPVVVHRLAHAKDVCWSADGTILACASSIPSPDAIIRIFRVGPGGELDLLHEHVETIEDTSRIAIAPDGESLAYGYLNRSSVTLIDRRGKVLRTLADPKLDGTWSLAFSPDGTRLASSCLRAAVAWDLATGVAIVSASMPKQPGDVCFTADGSLYAVARTQGLRQPKGTKAATVKTKLEDVNALASHGDALLSGGVPGLEIDTKTIPTEGLVTALSVTNDGKRVVASTLGARILVVDRKKARIERTIEAHSTSIERFCVSPDGRVAYATHVGPSTLRRWDLANGSSTVVADLGTDKGHVAMSADGSLLAVAHNGTMSKSGRWETTTGGTLRVFPVGAGGLGKEITYVVDHSIHGLAFSPAEPVLAVRASDRKIHLRSGSKLAKIETIDADDGLKLAWSPDGKRLVTYHRGIATLHDVTKRAVVATDVIAEPPKNQSGGYGGVIAWSSDGKRVVVTCSPDTGTEILSVYDEHLKLLERTKAEIEWGIDHVIVEKDALLVGTRRGVFRWKNGTRHDLEEGANVRGMAQRGEHVVIGTYQGVFLILS